MTGELWDDQPCDEGGTWYHRGPRPRHRCTICGDDSCYVWYVDEDQPVAPDVHICAAGCDGLPPAVLGASA